MSRRHWRRPIVCRVAVNLQNAAIALQMARDAFTDATVFEAVGSTAKWGIPYKVPQCSLPQSVSQPVGRQRLDMVFEIGRRFGRIGFREHADLARRHRHRSRPCEGVLQRDRDVERLRPAHLLGGADLQRVLKVLADSGAFMRELESDPLQNVGLADAGQLEQLRRVDRAGGQQNS